MTKGERQRCYITSTFEGSTYNIDDTKPALWLADSSSPLVVVISTFRLWLLPPAWRSEDTYFSRITYVYHFSIILATSIVSPKNVFSIPSHWRRDPIRPHSRWRNVTVFLLLLVPQLTPPTRINFSSRGTRQLEDRSKSIRIRSEADRWRSPAHQNVLAVKQYENYW